MGYIEKKSNKSWRDMRHISTLFLAFVIAITAFSTTITDDAGIPVNGLLRVTILAYTQTGDLIWTGTTDGSLPSLRVENGEIVNLDDLIPSYAKSYGDLRIEIRQDGRLIAEENIESTSLRRETPEEPGEISETMAAHLQIGHPGEPDDLVVHSPRTGFGITEPVERVDIDGALGLREGTAPTATTDFGKVYVDDGDGHLYFLDESGVATDLLETSSTVTGGSILASFDRGMIHTCTGETIWLGIDMANSDGPYTHLWTGDTAPLSATDSPSPSFTAGTPGTYHLTYDITDSEGKSSRHIFHIIVHGSPTPSVSSMPVTGRCVGQPVSLIGDGCYEKYCWDEGDCSKVLEVTEGGTYHLRVIDKWGCEGTTSHSVSFLALPTADIGTNHTSCYGESSFPIGGSPSASGGTPPYFYEWEGTGIPYISSTSVANPTFNPSAAAPGAYSFTLRITDANGCENTDGPIIVTVFDNPTAIASSSSPVCPLGTLELYGSASGGASPYTYSWTGPSGYSSSEQNPTVSSPLAGTYTLTVTDGNGCTSAPSNVTVSHLDAPLVTADPVNAEVEEGSTATYTVTATGDGLSYQWQQNTGSGWADITGATSSSYTTPSTTAGMDGYLYRCIVSGTCEPPDTSASASLTITSDLFAFISHTFTNCGQTGRTGPTLSTCRSSYSTSWDENPAFFNMSSQGIQEWTVPATGSYRIEARGAGGGNSSTGRTGGLGARMRGDFVLTVGDVLHIMVGQSGSYGSSSASGGGASFVVNSSTGTVLLVAGGGGGAMDANGTSAVTTNDGTTNGGTNDAAYCSSGAGYSGNGIVRGTLGGSAALSFLNGGNGGQGCNGGPDGGFGGGGSGMASCSGACGGGGGGGYNGGDTVSNHGQGGGSYNIGTSQSNSGGVNSGHGSVEIIQL